MKLLVSYEIQGEDHQGRSAIRDNYVKTTLKGTYVGGSTYWVDDTASTPKAVRDTIAGMLNRGLRDQEWIVVVAFTDAAWANSTKAHP